MKRVMKKAGGIKIIKEEFTKSAASFCRQVAAWVPDIISTFYLTKNHKTAKNSTTTTARVKNKHRFGILIIIDKFGLCLTKLKNIQILLSNISDRFLPTTKLFTGRKRLIKKHKEQRRNCLCGKEAFNSIVSVAKLY